LIEEKEQDLILESDDALQSLDPEQKLQTTLLVSTVYPEGVNSEYLEVATIRSPYSFEFEEGMSTRYITVTRTFTSSAAPTRPPSFDEEEDTYKTSSPLFQTETIPAPENILTSSLPEVFSPVEELRSSIETLPAVVLASSKGVTPPLKTVTETFSTREQMLKTSVLPVVINGATR